LIKRQNKLFKKSDIVLYSFLITVGLYVYYYYFLISDLPVWINDLKICGSVMEFSAFIKGHLNIFLYLVIFLIMSYFILKTIFQFILSTKNYIQLINYINSNKIIKYKNLYVINSKQAFAFSFGIFKTGIAVSKEIFKKFEKDEVRNIYLHEKGHLISGDSHKIFIFSVLSNLFPEKLKNKLIKDFSILKEIEADNYCSQRTDKLHLAKTLLKFYTVSSKVSIPMMNNHPEIRIKFLTDELNYKHIKVENIYLTFFALFGLFIILSYFFKYCLCGMTAFMHF
jgi:beta-lactamase regulating signal transducer with metallopeptidase domain